MRHRGGWSGTIVLVLVFLIPSVSAGITITSGEIILNAGESGVFCDFYVFATQNDGTYHVATAGEIQPLTVAIEPNDFSLNAINCPAERNARVACKNQLCETGAIDQCRRVCIEFQAPLIFSLDPQVVKYEGGISNTVQFGRASISEPTTFYVTVVPVDLKPILALAAAVGVGVLLLAIHLHRRRKQHVLNVGRVFNR